MDAMGATLKAEFEDASSEVVTARKQVLICMLILVPDV